MQILNTADQKRFITPTALDYTGVHRIFRLMIPQANKDLKISKLASNQTTYLTIKEVVKYPSDSVVTLSVGNKTNLEEQRQVTYEQRKELANSLGIQFIESSAKQNTNVELTFLTLASKIEAKMASLNEFAVDKQKQTCSYLPKIDQLTTILNSAKQQLRLKQINELFVEVKMMIFLFVSQCLCNNINSFIKQHNRNDEWKYFNPYNQYLLLLSIITFENNSNIIAYFDQYLKNNQQLIEKLIHKIIDNQQ